jgi:hypothetical protein
MSANDKNFPPMGFNIFFPGVNPWPRSIHGVSEAARSWDGAPYRHALYSDRHDVYSYCAIRITGRKVRWDETYRLTVRVDFDQEQDVLGEILLPCGGPFTIEEARTALAG